jgi:hypothetical protein
LWAKSGTGMKIELNKKKLKNPDWLWDLDEFMNIVQLLTPNTVKSRVIKKRSGL